MTRKNTSLLDTQITSKSLCKGVGSRWVGWGNWVINEWIVYEGKAANVLVWKLYTERKGISIFIALFTITREAKKSGRQPSNPNIGEMLSFFWKKSAMSLHVLRLNANWNVDSQLIQVLWQKEWVDWTDSVDML